jgi:hypothetical protein
MATMERNVSFHTKYSKKFDFREKALIFQTRVNKTLYCYRHYVQDFHKTMLFNNFATDAKMRSN